MTIRWSLFLPGVVAGLAGCIIESEPGGELLCVGEISAADYEQTCTTNADCVAVYEGDRADACRCENAAVHADAADAYAEALGVNCNGDECSADCVAVTAVCAAGICAVETEGEQCEGEMAADDYDRSCAQDSECTAVFEGSRTHECRQCAFSAVATSVFAEYDQVLGPASCSAGECLADCSASHGDEAICSFGTCQIPTLVSCGDTTCHTGQYCAVLGSDTQDPQYTCEDLPEACDPAAPDCGCLADTSTGLNVELCLEHGSCEVDEHGGLRLTCPSG